MSVIYNQIANRSLERIGALSDGLFAIAMTLIVLEIRARRCRPARATPTWRRRSSRSRRGS